MYFFERAQTKRAQVACPGMGGDAFRILRLKFETSYANRLLCNKHKNVSCAKRSFLKKKVVSIFGLIIIFGAAKIYLF